jgi:hypothetical protein
MKTLEYFSIPKILGHQKFDGKFTFKFPECQIDMIDSNLVQKRFEIGTIYTDEKLVGRAFSLPVFIEEPCGDAHIVSLNMNSWNPIKIHSPEILGIDFRTV